MKFLNTNFWWWWCMSLCNISFFLLVDLFYWFFLQGEFGKTRRDAGILGKHDKTNCYKMFFAIQPPIHPFLSSTKNSTRHDIKIRYYCSSCWMETLLLLLPVTFSCFTFKIVWSQNRVTVRYIQRIKLKACFYLEYSKLLFFYFSDLIDFFCEFYYVLNISSNNRRTNSIFTTFCSDTSKS